MYPLPGSPAICAGLASNVPSGITTDQRGYALDTSCPAGSSYVDAGAVQTNWLTVTTLTDQTNTGTTCTGGATCSLRDAIRLANASTTGGDIAFQSGLTGTLTLSSGLTISGKVNLQGPGANQLTVSGGGSSSNFIAFTIDSGVTANISGLTIANGRHTSGSGGGIYNQAGTLTVTNSAFSGNFSSGNGGGIYNEAGTLTVINSTFSGNSASYYGGGMANGAGTLTVTNSTFSGNSATSGGGIFNGYTLTLANSIVSGNTASGAPDDLYNYTGTNYTDSGGNVVGYRNQSAVNTTAIALSALGNYGGTTRTMIPLPGSPAICVGLASKVPSGVTTDQRGFQRKNTTYTGYSSTTPCVDAGAVQTNYQSIQLTNIPTEGYSGLVNQAIGPAPVVSVTENSQNLGGVPITLSFSGTGTASGLGPVTTVAGTGATFSSLAVNAAGNDTLSASLTIVGTDTISTGNATLTIAYPSTTTTPQSASAIYSASAQNVSLSARVTNSASTVNGGTVTFTLMQGSTQVGTAVTSSAVANGAAGVTYILPAGTAAGDYTIQAVYDPGSASFAPSSGSSTLTLAPLPGVTISSISEFNLPQGGNGTGSFTLSGTGGVSGTVTLSCSGLPSGLTCALTPSSINASSLPATITVSVSAAGTRITGNTRHQNLPPGWNLGLLLPGLVVTGTCLTRKRRWTGAVLLSMLLLLFLLAGCGGSSHSPSTTSSSVSAGTYTGTVTASGTGISSVSANFSVAVTN